jgi:hypothetical protein
MQPVSPLLQATASAAERAFTTKTCSCRATHSTFTPQEHALERHVAEAVACLISSMILTL